MSNRKIENTIEYIKRQYLRRLKNSGKPEIIPEEMNRIFNELCEYLNRIRESQSDEELNKNIQKLLNFLKDNNEKIQSIYAFKDILDYNFLSSRALLNGCFLFTDTAPVIDAKSRIYYSKDDQPEKIVNHIVQKIRYNLFNSKIDRESSWVKPPIFDSNDDSLVGECIHTTEKVVKLAKRMGLVVKAYRTQDIIDEENLLEGHAFAIIEIGGKKWIIDCTYRQFFSLAMNGELRRFFRPYKKNISMGEKVLLNEQSLEMAKQLLHYGWVEATPENIKLYLDTFVKDGLEYSKEEYINKLNEAKQMSIHFDKVIGEKRPHIQEIEDSEHSYIIESEPLIIDNFSEEEFNPEWDNSIIMDTLVQRERLRLSRMYGKDEKLYDIKKDNLRWDCINSVRCVVEDCHEKEIKCKSVYTRDYDYKIGNSRIKLPRQLGHFFTLVFLKKKLYLIDCTYRQFFSKTYCNENEEIPDSRNIYD